MEGEFLRALDTYIAKGKMMPMQLVKVTAVNDVTCDAVTVNEDEVFDIRLRSVENEATEGVILKPQIGSWLLITNLGNHEHFAILYEAVEEMQVKIGVFQMKLNTEGIEIKRGTESLKTVLNDVLDKIKTLKIITSTGPALPDPSEGVLIDELALRLNSILK